MSAWAEFKNWMTKNGFPPIFTREIDQTQYVSYLEQFEAQNSQFFRIFNSFCILGYPSERCIDLSVAWSVCVFVQEAERGRS